MFKFIMIILGEWLWREAWRGRAVGVADLATFLLELGTFGASAASYYNWKRDGNTGLGLSVEEFF